MAAATAAINTKEAVNDILPDLPVEANTNVYVGTMAAMNAAGNIVPASDAAGLHVLGRCEGLPRTVDPNLVGSDGINNPGAAGAVTVNIKRGRFRWNNSAGGNAITKAMVGQPCYVYDDNTVGIAGGTAHAIVAGQVVNVDSQGVWVDTRRPGPLIAPYALTSAQNATAAAVDLATSEALANALKANYNALQTNVAAILARLG